MGLFNFNKKKQSEQKKVDYLYHLVISLARLQKVNPRALGSVAEDISGNIEYIQMVLDQSNKEKVS